MYSRHVTHVRRFVPTAMLVCLLAAPAHSQSHPTVPVDSGASYFPIPGACVAIPQRAWLVRRSIRQASPPDPQYPSTHDDEVSMGTSAPFDLDGDGAHDVFVPEPAAGDCNEDFHFAIYLSHGMCGHRVGMVRGNVDAALLATAPRHAGLPDLTTVTERGQQPDPRNPAELRRVTYTYRFDGVAYREVNQSVSTSVCHHCAIETCQHSLATH